ncbi:hypothetical protein AZL_010650 [Azospirillum sp. B510]|nr:hypothetical protein AZL_010650 [Azospirillum sp. B510]
MPAFNRGRGWRSPFRPALRGGFPGRGRGLGMGLFDFLKVTVTDKKAADPPARRMPISVIQCDGKSFPIVSLTAKGFVARGFDGSLVVGQNAKVSVRVDDADGKFTFNATVSVVEIKGDTVGAIWSILPTDVDAVIRQYAQRRKK